MSDPRAEIGSQLFVIDEDCDEGQMLHHFTGQAAPECPWPCGGDISPRINRDYWTGDEWVECQDCERKFDVVRD